jgi:hypothetical protein
MLIAQLCDHIYRCRNKFGMIRVILNLFQDLTTLMRL